jgi:alkaline phosphatase
VTKVSQTFNLLRTQVCACAIIAILALPASASFAQDKEPANTRLLSEDIQSSEQWFAKGAHSVAKRADRKINTNRAKNVILFIGDGMGVSTLTAARILEGQLRGEPGEENYLSFEKFPYSGLVKTYNVDAQVADSAGTASALNTGIKTRIGVINTSPTHPQNVCEGATEARLTPAAEYAERAGMSTGVVSTARLTHATPAAVYASAPSRDWENDSDIPKGSKACSDIASQITGMLGGDGLDVALGGGRREFQPVGTEKGRREDGRNIIDEWVQSSPDAHYVGTAEELANTDLNKTSRLLGLFDDSHMDFELDRTTNPSMPTIQPHLADMTEAAIKLLSQNENGFYLMVEGGRVDHGHHAGNAQRALTDAVALSEAVKRAAALVDLDETLILVTADHSHVFTMAGYPARGNPIFGLVTPPHSPENAPRLAEDGKPYTTLGYNNGPGAIKGERETLTSEQVEAPNYLQQSAVPLESETHGGEDVALFAVGPWSHLATGTIEQNEIFHIINHALGLIERAKK